jgi:hypothetical protein
LPDDIFDDDIDDDAVSDWYLCYIWILNFLHPFEP